MENRRGKVLKYYKSSTVGHAFALVCDGVSQNTHPFGTYYHLISRRKVKTPIPDIHKPENYSLGCAG
jgi:hypothetical protein